MKIVADIKIPIVTKLSSDSPDEIRFAATCTASDHIIIVNKNAKKIAALLAHQRSSQETHPEHPTPLPNNHVLIRGFMRCFKTEERARVRNFLKHCIDQV